MVYKRLERFLIQLDSIDSTNDYANKLIKSRQVSNGTIILTHHQHTGRGQRSNTWTAEQGKNLTCSIILFPKLSVKQAFYFNIIASLSVRKCLNDLGLIAEIKWPNDILIEGKKVCGILIENQLSGDEISSAIVGIGLNVNQEKFTGLENVTSIFSELNEELLIVDVLDQIYGYLDFYYNLLLESNFELLLKHYYEHLYLLGIPAKYEDRDGQFEGAILGIDVDGRLLVQRVNGKQSYDIKEIRYCS